MQLVHSQKEASIRMSEQCYASGLCETQQSPGVLSPPRFSVLGAWSAEGAAWCCPATTGLCTHLLPPESHKGACKGLCLGTLGQVHLAEMKSASPESVHFHLIQAG